MTSRFRAAIADSGPVVILAAIAAAGSFTHIRDTAAENGQTGWMSWAVAVCVDLLCVMAARERQRDARTGRQTRRVSWPTFVLALGVTLSLAANLAQALPTVWGYTAAGIPCAAFLVAVSMLERRAGARAAEATDSGTEPVTVPDEGGTEPSAVPGELAAEPVTVPREPATVTPIAPTNGLTQAIRVSDKYRAEHGKWITRDLLRTELAPCSSAQASEYLRIIKTADTAERAEVAA